MSERKCRFVSEKTSFVDSNASLDLWQEKMGICAYLRKNWFVQLRRKSNKFKVVYTKERPSRYSCVKTRPYDEDVGQRGRHRLESMWIETITFLARGCHVKLDTGYTTFIRENPLFDLIYWDNIWLL